MEVGGLQDAMENKSDDNDFDKNSNSDPVVYQLVRVEGDGTLVPATEDEVFQFEHFLHDDKVDLPSIDDVARVEEYFTNDCSTPEKPDFEEGHSKLDTVDVQTQILDAGLEEDRLCTLDDSVDHPSKFSAVHDQQPDKVNTEQDGNNIAQQDNASAETTKSTVLNDLSAEKEKVDACSTPANDSSTGQSVSGVTSLVPDFSILRGEVCLDNLTIRELQEAFRATFGRETTVKDKLWLKRRIAMGLTNSCDVPSSGCVVKNYKVIGMVAKQEVPTVEEISNMRLKATPLVRDQVIVQGHQRDSPSRLFYQSDEQQRSSKRLKRVPTNSDEPQVTIFTEQGTTKRLRKPTKRYIEELSDVETHDSTGRLTSGKRPVNEEVLLRPRATPFHEVDSLSTTYPTRKDTLGGCTVDVPYVSRMRRGRPRSNYIPFSDHEPSVECAEVHTADEVNLEADGEQVNHENTQWKGEHIETAGNNEVHGLEAKDFCNTDVNAKVKRGGKRKHHRAWTLSEVMKLVDGVARYGAGKWSEIRRLAFSSYSYRTSVDLKDKWRNLIRASQTQLPTENDGVCPRKYNPSTVPIPPSILLRVKELAVMQPQAGNLTMPIKFSGQSSKVVQGKGSGFL